MMFRLSLILAACFSLTSYGQGTTSYSFSEFFAMIEAETDSIFTLKNAEINTDPETDVDFYFGKSVFTEIINPLPSSLSLRGPIRQEINKHIVLENVQFTNNENITASEVSSLIQNIRFRKSVTLTNVLNVAFWNCVIEGDFRYISNADYEGNDMKFACFVGNDFKSNARFLSVGKNTAIGQVGLGIYGNTFDETDNSFVLINMNLTFFDYCGVLHNTFNIKNGGLTLIFENPSQLEIIDNTFNVVTTNLKISINDENLNHLRCISNKFQHFVNLSFHNPVPSAELEWKQFKNCMITRTGLDYLGKELNLTHQPIIDSEEKLINNYLEDFRIANNGAYKAEMEMRGTFYNYYKSKFDKESANEVYIELKDLETDRLEYLQKSNPTFNGYFKWKMNQFLKVFSDYGTNPTKSIIFSMYVILLFGAIYLFFPNSWDYHGKYRIVHRYGFLMQYMTRTAGIQDIYLERRQRDFEEHQKFEAVIADSKNKVPKFFTYSAQLLNKWAKADSLVVAFLLKRVDVLKGKWAELSKGKKRWKAVLLIFMLVIGIVYDLFIKVLNALMLSINTFTTLGFGEIPIKGLPRYLAIVQGFIGWFLLTIFSVSLISQLME